MNLERIRPIANLILSSDEFIVLDIETSGLHPLKGGRIIEIGAVHLKNGEIIATFNQLIHPEQKIYAKTIELTGITNEELQGKPNYRKVLPEFFEFIKGKIVVAHNANFDWNRFLVYFFEKVGINANNHVVDTLILSKFLFPDSKEHNLGALTNQFGFENHNAHRAYDDAVVTAKIFLEFIKLLKNDSNFSSTPQIDLFSVKSSSSDENNEKEIFKIAEKPKEEFKYSEFTIKRARFWEKSNSVRVLFRRIYIILDIGTVYFDIESKTWGNKDAVGNINFKEIERRLLNSPTKLQQLKGYVTKEMLMEYFNITDEHISQNDSLYEIKRIKYWEKAEKKRIYITLSKGTVFFDLVDRNWGSKDVGELIDFSRLQRDVLKYLGFKELSSFYSFTGDKIVA